MYATEAGERLPVAGVRPARLGSPRNTEQASLDCPISADPSFELNRVFFFREPPNVFFRALIVTNIVYAKFYVTLISNVRNLFARIREATRSVFSKRKRRERIRNATDASPVLNH